MAGAREPANRDLQVEVHWLRKKEKTRIVIPEAEPGRPTGDPRGTGRLFPPLDLPNRYIARQ